MKKIIHYSLLQLFCLISFTVFAFGSVNDEDECTIKIFDVGQGNAIGIRYKFKENDQIKYETMLIDAGSTDCVESAKKHNTYFSEKLSADNYKVKIIKDIRNFMLGDDAIVKSIVITHAHDDHYNLLHKVFNTAERQEKIENIVLSGSVDLYSTKSDISGWLNGLQDQDVIKYTRRKEGKKRFTLNKTGFKNRASFTERDYAPKVKLLSINQGINSKNRNDDSIVLQILCHQTVSVLLTGDATAKTWQGVKKLGNTHSHILLIPHHGSKANKVGKTDDGILFNIFDIIQPNIAIFSTGLYSRYAHPHNNVYEELEGKMAYRDDNPLILSFFDNNKSKIERRTNNSIFSTVDHGIISLHTKEKPIHKANHKGTSTEIPFTIEVERSQEPIFQLEDSQGNIMRFDYHQNSKVPATNKIKYKPIDTIEFDQITIQKPKAGGFFLVKEKGESFVKYAYAPEGKIENAYYFIEEVDPSDSVEENSDENSEDS
jgi:beta-lactamase superfamily II metal-dependent hydrolase